VPDETAANGPLDSSGKRIEEDYETVLDESANTGSLDTGELRGALPPSETDQVPPESEATLSGEKQSKPRSVRRVLKDWGPWKRWSRHREFRREDLEEPHSWQDRDSEQNAQGRLPDDEHVQVPAIWVAELYTSSTVAGLLAGITHLGWEYGRIRDDSLTKWMSDVREGRQAGWMSLGLVSPPEDPHLMRERTAPLPEGVREALPTLMSVTPSVTALVIAFLMDDESADLLDVPFRANFSTRREPLFRPWHVVQYVLRNGPLRFGHRIYDPDMIRCDRIKSSMRELERGCVDWVREHLPGAFTSLEGASFPTATLLVTEKVSPLTEEAGRIRAFEGLAIDRDYDAWESDEWPKARLVLPRSWDGEGSRLVFACRRRDAFPDQPGYPDPSSNWTIAQRADDLVRGLLSRWSLTCLLDGYHERLSALRDRTARDGGYRPVHDLKQLRSLARTELYDIAACAQEIEEFVESDQAYRYGVLEMTYAREVRGKRLDLLASLRSSQGMRAQQVQRESGLLQSTLSTSNDLSQTISNIRIQRLVVLLAVVSTAIALWALFLALWSLPS